MEYGGIMQRDLIYVEITCLYHMPEYAFNISTFARDSGISSLPADSYNGKQCGTTFRPWGISVIPVMHGRTSKAL